MDCERGEPRLLARYSRPKLAVANASVLSPLAKSVLIAGIIEILKWLLPTALISSPCRRCKHRSRGGLLRVRPRERAPIAGKKCGELVSERRGAGNKRRLFVFGVLRSHFDSFGRFNKSRGHTASKSRKKMAGTQAERAAELTSASVHRRVSADRPRFTVPPSPLRRAVLASNALGWLLFPAHAHQFADGTRLVVIEKEETRLFLVTATH